jgi:uncharacterized protein (DUF305 family)
MRLSGNIALTCGFVLATIAAPALAQQGAPAGGVGRVIAMAPDCATADAKMMTMGKTVSSMPASGNLDRDFSAMVAANAKMMMEAAKMEMACSKKPEMRKMADGIAKQNSDLLHNLQISSGSTH